MGKTSVWCTFQVPGFHNWPSAPDVIAFLRDKHRHVFHVKVECTVNHDDREIEFITLQKDAKLAFNRLGNTGLSIAPNFGARSCEHLAHDLYASMVDDYPTICSITVSEDGENGATVEYTDLLAA